MKPKLTTVILLILGITISSCGLDKDKHSNNDGRNTGSYHASLVFPADIPRIETNAKVLEGIDCNGAGISVIRFGFYDAADPSSFWVEDQFPCSDHHATVGGIPAGNNRAVEVTAENQGGEILLWGEERNITIRANQDTKGGDIAMIESNPDSFGTRFGMTFVRIPAGEFDMGSPLGELGRNDDEARHQVRLTQDFYMQATEVTRDQWLLVMGENPSYFQNCGMDCPVESVSWDDVQEFLTRLNAQIDDGREYYLPTEAQWEYAARAGSDTAFYGGDITEPEGNDPILNTLGWYIENSNAGYVGCYELDDGRCIGPQLVSARNPNDFGLHDMHGNVHEWCQDWYGEYPSGSVTDPVGPASGTYRVVRGGSWGSNARDCRSANRGRGNRGNRSDDYGFRVAASLSR